MSAFLGFVECAGCGDLFPVRSPQALARAKWCSGRCRKRSYGDPCVDCGARTSYGAERKRIAEPRCMDCASRRYTIWTRDTLVRAIQDWAAEYGEPPAVADWNGWHCRNTLHDEKRALRYEQTDGRWPSHVSVYGVFGSWGAALEAAGFEPRAANGGNGNESRKRSMRAKAAA